jgi:PAS domain-containing protein
MGVAGLDLRASELNLLETQFGIGMWSYKFATDELFWSDGMFRLMGFEPNAIEPETKLFFDVLHPDDRAHAERAWSMLPELHSTELEFRMIRPSGAIRRIRCQTHLLFDNWVPCRAIGGVIDVTEICDLRSVIATSERRYVELLQAVSTIVWTVDAGGRLISSPSWCALTNLQPHEIRDWGWLDAIHHEHASALRAEWENSVRTGRPFQMDVLVRRADQRWTLYEFKAAPIVHRRRAGTADSVGVCVDLQPREWMYFGDRPEAAPIALDVSRDLRVTGSLMRGARGLLDWPAKKLAHKARVSISTIRRMEADSAGAHRDLTAGMIQAAFEEAGVEFLPLPDGTTALRLR